MLGAAQKLHHLAHQMRLAAHGAHRYFSLELLDGDLEHALALFERERVALAAAAASHIHGYAGIPQSPQMLAQRCFVQPACVVERGDADHYDTQFLCHLRLREFSCIRFNALHRRVCLHS